MSNKYYICFIADKRISESTYWTFDWLHAGWHSRHW